MKASEARQRAYEVNTNTDSGQLNEILSAIQKTADKGEYELWYYKSVRKDVRLKLIALGYSVGLTQSDRNESMTKISF